MAEKIYDRVYVLNVCIQLELSAVKFYRKLAQRFPEDGELFLRLAREEEAHSSVFQRLAEKDVEQSRVDLGSVRDITTLDENNFLNNLMTQHENLGHLNNIVDALELSAEHEKGAEFFYISSLGLLPDSDKKTVTQIMLIENRHRLKVEALAEEYRGINV